MKCEAVSLLASDDLVRCQQDSVAHGLCFYHFKMMRKKIQPCSVKQSEQRVVRVEKGGHVLYDGRRDGLV